MGILEDINGIIIISTVPFETIGVAIGIGIGIGHKDRAFSIPMPLPTPSPNRINSAF